MVAVIEVELMNVPNAKCYDYRKCRAFWLSHASASWSAGSAEQSYCILMTSHKLSADSKTRIETMVRTNDGF
jgi:ATP-dependent DNA helicase RecG